MRFHEMQRKARISLRALLVIMTFAAVIVGVRQWLHTSESIPLCKTYGDDAISKLHIESLLTANRISYREYPNDFCFFFVSRRHAERASTLLQHEAEKPGASFCCEVDDHFLHYVRADNSFEFERSFNSGRNIDEILQDDSLDCLPLLSTIHQSGKIDFAQFPIVERIKYSRRECLAGKQSTRIAYEVSLRLSPSPESRGKWYYCQVLGEQVSVMRARHYVPHRSQ